MTPIEQLGSLCGDRYFFTLPPIMTYQEAARELLERLASEKLARIIVKGECDESMVSRHYR